MKLEKAIEIAKEHCKLNLVDKNPDLKDALKLLISAGQRIIWMRSAERTQIEQYLDGETE